MFSLLAGGHSAQAPSSGLGWEEWQRNFRSWRRQRKQRLQTLRFHAGACTEDPGQAGLLRDLTGIPQDRSCPAQRSISRFISF